jgi:hypothetical protein
MTKNQTFALLEETAPFETDKLKIFKLAANIMMHDALHRLSHFRVLPRAKTLIFTNPLQCYTSNIPHPHLHPSTS